MKIMGLMVRGVGYPGVPTGRPRRQTPACLRCLLRLLVLFSVFHCYRRFHFLLGDVPTRDSCLGEQRSSKACAASQKG